MRLVNADRLIMELLHLWRYFLERKRAKETMIIWTVITRVNEMAEEETWKHKLSKERQRTANARPTHECVDLISREDAIDAINKAVTKEAARWSVKELPSEPVGISDNIEEMLQRFAQIVRNLEDMKILLSQRTGHWIEYEEQNHVEVCYHCSECGFEAWGEHEKTSFCGGCGAWMTEREGE